MYSSLNRWFCHPEDGKTAFLSCFIIILICFWFMFANTWYFCLSVNKLDWLIVFVFCNIFEELGHCAIQISENNEKNLFLFRNNFNSCGNFCSLKFEFPINILWPLGFLKIWGQIYLFFQWTIYLFIVLSELVVK